MSRRHHAESDCLRAGRGVQLDVCSDVLTEALIPTHPGSTGALSDPQGITPPESINEGGSDFRVRSRRRQI